MNVRRVFMVVPVLALTAILAAQATQPSNDAALELRANEEFARGNYALALPMLQNLAVTHRNDPEKLGPIFEKIRVCERNIAGGNPGEGVAPAGPRKPHEKPRDGEVLELAIQELGNFDYDADRGGNIPADVVALSGSRVRLIGFMIPMDQAQNITQFALVPSLFACCFGLPPTIQHTIVVNCPDGKAVSYYPDEIVVEGTLSVEEKTEDDFIISIFEMEVSSVKPAAK